MAIILAGGEGERLSILSQERAKPAVPFGGKYRIIDFTLSNCVNSDIHDVVVLTQYNPRSLNDHIGLGRPWDLDRNNGGVKLLQPYIARGQVAEWYRGTADAVLRNMNVVEHDPSDVVVVLAGDHIYKMDYQPFIAAHRRRRADVTIAVRRVPLAEASRMGILALDDADRVTEWQEKPKQPKSDLASMGVYVFSKKALRRWLSEDRRGLRSRHHPGDARGRRPRVRLPLQRLLAGRRHDPVVLGEPTWPSSWTTRSSTCTTRTGSSTPAPRNAPRPRSGRRPRSTARLISHGCVINGTVVNSVLSPGVRVDVGAVVRDSIVMFDSVIRSGAVVDRVDPRQGGRGRSGRHRRRRAIRRPAEQAGARPPQHRHHGRRQARGHPSRRPDRAERARSPRTSARPTSSRRSSRAANRSNRKPGTPTQPTTTAEAPCRSRGGAGRSRRGVVAG